MMPASNAPDVSLTRPLSSKFTMSVSQHIAEESDYSRHGSGFVEVSTAMRTLGQDFVVEPRCGAVGRDRGMQPARLHGADKRILGAMHDEKGRQGRACREAAE